LRASVTRRVATATAKRNATRRARRRATTDTLWRVRRVLLVVVFLVVSAACNALTGVGDLDPSLDDGLVAPDRTDDDADAPADSGGPDTTCTCPTGFSCAAGACICPSTICGGDAGDAGPLVCTDLATDPKNCNACGAACAIPNAIPKCAAGKCAFDTCSPGFSDCDGEPANGCECPTDSCLVAKKQCAKRVFVTSALYKGDFGGLAGADARCQERAVAASLPGTYKAWLSTEAASPSNRFVKATIPYVLVDGTVVASNYTDLTDGTLAAPINETETGAAPATVSFCAYDPIRPWSSTLANGTFSATSGNCTDWTVTSGSAHWGAGSSTASDWSQACSGGTCSFDAPLFCFQQ
jgi:hypothetical protein